MEASRKLVMSFVASRSASELMTWADFARDNGQWLRNIPAVIHNLWRRPHCGTGSRVDRKLEL